MKKMKIMLSIAGFLLAITQAYAQELTEQMAIDSMERNNYQIINSELFIDQYGIDASTKFSLGSTSLSYSYGQMNSNLTDGNFQINQSLGNPLHQSRKSKEASLLVDVLELEKERTVEQHTWLVRSAWHRWVYLDKKIQLLNDQLDGLETHVKQQEERALLGDVSELDLGMSEIYQSDLENKINDLKVEKSVTFNQLKSLTLIKSEFQVPQTNIELISEVPIVQNDTIPSTLIQIEERKVEVANSTFQKEKARYFPEFSLGYVNQSIDHVRGLQAATLGLSMPIFNRNHQAVIRKAQIQTLVQKNIYKNTQQQIEIKINELQAKLLMRYELLQKHDERWTAQIELLNNAADLEYDEGEIDLWKFLKIKESTINIEMKRLELINDYNQTLLELQYYTSGSKK